MTGPLTAQAVELAPQMPSGFHDPKYFVLAGVVAVGGTILDRYKERLDNRLEQQTDEGEARLGLADPYIAEQAGIDNRMTRLAERFGYYAAVACATLASVQVGTQPYSSHAHVRGAAAVVVEAGDAANVTDSGSSTSRLQMSISGSLSAAARNNVPFTFILDGASPLNAGSTPAQGKDLTEVKKKINASLTSTFQNGDSLQVSLQNALASNGSQPNNVIIIGSDVEGGDATAIAQAESQLHGKDTLDAVVVGNSNNTNQIGVATVNAPVDAQSFRSLLGANHVATATSSSDVQGAITHLLSHAEASETKAPNNLFGDLAIFAGVLGLAGGMRRRLAGIYKLSKGGNQ